MIKHPRYWTLRQLYIGIFCMRVAIVLLAALLAYSFLK